MVGTKLDLCEINPSSRKVNYGDAIALAKEKGFEYFETSAFNNSNNPTLVYEKLIYTIHTDRNPIRSIDGEI